MEIENAIRNLIVGTALEGGSTQSLRGEAVPDSGFMVGGFANSLIFDSLLVTDASHWAVSFNGIANWVNNNLTLATAPEMYIGGWIDKETNSMYVDLSKLVVDREAAILTAKELGEIAIWDLGKGEEIRVQ